MTNFSIGGCCPDDKYIARVSIYQNTTKRKDFGVYIIGQAHYVSSPLEIIRESGRILGNRGGNSM